MQSETWKRVFSDWETWLQVEGVVELELKGLAQSTESEGGNGGG